MGDIGINLGSTKDYMMRSTDMSHGAWSGYPKVEMYDHTASR